jgi:hypothetical protein
MHACVFISLIIAAFPLSAAHAALRIDCTPTGRDCPSDMACFPTGTDVYECLPSDGIPIGGVCNPDMEGWENLPCEDGTLCADFDGDLEGECLAFCTGEAPCADAAECIMPVFEGVDDLGVCPPACTDQDADGACADVDCDDQDPTSFPGAEELCDDGRDNDCDGAIDNLDDDCGGDDPDAGVDGGPDADPDADTDAGADTGADVMDPGAKKDPDACACRAAGGRPSSLPAVGGILALGLLIPFLRRRRNRRFY